MKKFFLLVFISTLPSIAFWNIFTQVQIWDIQLEYISYDISSEIYNIKVAISDDAVTLTELSSDYNAISGINWVFFCPEDYTQCNGLNYTINERFLDGEDLSFYPDTGERWIFAWDLNWSPFIHKTGQINPLKRDEIVEWLGNFPILLSDWKNTLAYYEYVDLYDNKMRSSLPRHFICSNQEKTHIYIWKSSAISLEWLVPILGEIGCWDALNLDAGASAHLNYNGREIIKWNRKIIDWVLLQHRDINVEVIQQNIDEIITKIETYISKQTKRAGDITLDTLLAYIAQIRDSVNDKYTSHIYNWEWKHIGYSVNITSLPDLKKVYLFNSLERRIKELY